MEIRKTSLGRERSFPRIEPSFGTAPQRKARKRREAEARNAEYQKMIKSVKEPTDKSGWNEVRRPQ